MKKLSILFLITFLLGLSNVFASAKVDEIKALIVIPNGEELPSSESSSITKGAEEKLKANLSKYTLINIIDSSNKKAILELQKQSESGIYGSENYIEVGELVNASHGLFLNLRKINGRYTVSISVTNLTTGANLTTIVSSNKATTEEDIYINTACVIDLLTIELCEELGCPLTPSNKYILRYGEDDFTGSKRNSLYEEDIKEINKSIQSLDEEINLLNTSTDLEAAAKQKQLEIKKELLQSRLDKKEEDIRRAREEENRRAEDNKRDMERTDEQRRRIEEKSNELNSKVQQIRLQKKEGLSLLGQIRNIEFIKKTYCEINQEIDETAFRYRLDYQKKVDRKADEIRNRPLANSEKTSDGHITKTASENRKKEFKEFSKNEETHLEYELTLLKNKFDKQKKDLLEEINKGYDDLSDCTVTTLGNELVVTFGNYDGERYGWDLYVSVQSDEIILFETTSFISYKTLTGKEPVPGYGEYGYEDYNETVDFFVSMFSRGEPYLTFSLDYYVTPLSEKYPSKYKFNFGNFYCYKTENLKVRKDLITSRPLVQLNLRANAIDRQMYPAWDIRDIDVIKEEEIREAEIQHRMERERVEEYEHHSSSSSSGFDFGRTHGAGNFGYASSADLGSGSLIGLELSLNLGFTPYYINYRMNCFGLEKDKSKYFNQNGGGKDIYFNTFGLGVRAQFGFFETYMDVGLGFDVYNPTREQKTDPYGTAKQTKTKELQFVTNLTGGICFILFDHFSINFDVSMYLLPIIKPVSYIDKNTSYSIFGATIGGALRL